MAKTAPTVTELLNQAHDMLVADNRNAICAENINAINSVNNALLMMDAKAKRLEKEAAETTATDARLAAEKAVALSEKRLQLNSYQDQLKEYAAQKGTPAQIKEQQDKITALAQSGDDAEALQSAQQQLQYLTSTVGTADEIADLQNRITTLKTELGIK